MAVHGCSKQNILDHADEEGSRNFKISSAISMPGQMGSPSDTAQPQNHEGSCLKPLSPKGENTYSRRSKVCPVAKVLMERSEATISRPETSDAHKTVSVKSHDNAMSDDSDDNKPLNFKFSSRGNKVSSSSKAVTQSSELVPTNAQTSRPELSNARNKILEKCHGKTATFDNSDDNKPLAFKLSSSRSNKTSSSGSAVAEGSDLIPKKASSSGLETSTAHGKDMEKSHGKTAQSDDSDEDVPLSSKLSSFSRSAKARNSMPSKKPSYDSNDGKPISFSKSANISGARKNNSMTGNKVSGTSKANNMRGENPSISKLSKSNLGSTEKSYDSCEQKPLASNSQQNGSSKKEPDCISEKRLLDSADDSTSLSNKKLKTSLPIALTNVKHEAVIKEERKTYGSDDDDHIPLAHRTKKPATSSNQSSSKKKLKVTSTSFKKGKKITKKIVNSKFSRSSKIPPGSGEGQKWTTLEHNGVIFPPPYKPHGIKMLYNGKPVDLTPEQEEVATMFAVMKDTEYATKKTFIDNYMNDWRVILGKNHVIKKFELCDFTPIYEWHMAEKEKKKQMSTEEKKALKEEKLKQEEKYMWATVDGVKEKVGNFRVEPPGLFRGRGEHPKMGKLKRRIYPRDITINIGKEAPIPESPIPGERWKEIKHDNTVTWLAFWNDPINTKEFKYVFLAASSALKGQSDKEKYEKARKLKDYIGNIRVNYTKDFRSKDETKQQIAVATYLIDKLALRAGNEKDDDEADTVGCCTLKVENVTLVPPNKLQFDFLGKDSIRYFNTVEVELPVYKAIGEFRKGGKKGSDDLFDKLDTSKLNAHLKELMPGLTAKVFRTYNASITLDEMLNKETRGDAVPEKIAVYQHANKEVAIICNHQRSVSKSHDAQMLRLDEKIKELKAQQDELKVDLSRARKGKPPLKDAEGKTKRNLSREAWEKRLMQVELRIEKIELDKKIKEDLKTVALGTSKINYLDPRISVAWCKRNEVPIEKIFNKSLLAKFCWAMDAEPSFRF